MRRYNNDWGDDKEDMEEAPDGKWVRVEDAERLENCLRWLLYNNTYILPSTCTSPDDVDDCPKCHVMNALYRSKEK